MGAIAYSDLRKRATAQALGAVGGDGMALATGAEAADADVRIGTGRAARLFEQGDLKYVILRLLEEKPRHGYEIIKDLESRFGGSYAPSPGTVYPTLDHARRPRLRAVVPEEGGKKIYEITDEGRKHLAEHSTTVNDIFDRIARFVGGLHRRADDGAESSRSKGWLARPARRQHRTSPTKRRSSKIREIIQRAADGNRSNREVELRAQG